MHKKLFVCLLAGLIVLAGCNGGTPQTSSPYQAPPPSKLAEMGFDSPNIPRITAEEFKLKYDKREPYVLVDVRPRPQYVESYIPGARNIPNSPWDVSFEELAKLPKDRLIVTYCDCPDDGEAAMAAERLLLSGYTDVKILWKGIYYWIDIGGEVT